MFKITFNGKTLKELWSQERRKDFVKNEVPPGKMLVMWQDCDTQVYGWQLSADNEVELLKVAALIYQVKHDKLVQTVTGGAHGNKAE